MSSTGDLSIKARFLRNGSQKAYDDFVAAFAAYTESAVGISVMATENWQLYQGHAQQCIKILKTLEEARNG